MKFKKHALISALLIVAINPIFAESYIDSLKDLTTEQITELRQLGVNEGNNIDSTYEVQQALILTEDQHDQLSHIKSNSFKGLLLVEQEEIAALDNLTPEQMRSLKRLTLTHDEHNVINELSQTLVLTQEQLAEIQEARDGKQLVQSFSKLDRSF